MSVIFGLIAQTLKYLTVKKIFSPVFYFWCVGDCVVTLQYRGRATLGNICKVLILVLYQHEDVSNTFKAGFYWPSDPDPRQGSPVRLSAEVIGADHYRHQIIIAHGENVRRYKLHICAYCSPSYKKCCDFWWSSIELFRVIVCFRNKNAFARLACLIPHQGLFQTARLAPSMASGASIGLQPNK